MTLSAALASAGLELPPVAKPVAAYIPALVTPLGAGKVTVRTSGQLPLKDGQLVASGQVGDRPDKTDLAAAQAAAKQAGLNALAAAAAAVGGVDQLEKLVKLTVFVSSDPHFYDQALVANGASEMFGQIFSAGHIRSAVGVAVLPLNATVEVEAEFLATVKE